jgi:hypothetical protein
MVVDSISKEAKFIKKDLAILKVEWDLNKEGKGLKEEILLVRIQLLILALEINKCKLFSNQKVLS